MSLTQQSAAPSARDVRQLVKASAAHLAGRERGPDHAPGRRVPHRLSWDVDDTKAKPWRPVGDGSVAQGLSHREALLQTAREHYRQGWRDYPLEQVREARRREGELSIELDAGEAPVGRPAAIRQELGRIGDWLARARARLRRIDVTVLEALLGRIDFATGRLFPSHDTIAADAACSRNSVIEALRRLKAHGFIDWVRRTVRTGNEGEFAPQREQTSNAYFLEHRQRMAPRTWQRFVQILVTKLRRLGAIPAGIARAPAESPSAELRSALESFGASLRNAST